MIFNDEEITDERIAERSRQVQKQIEAVRKANAGAEKLQREARRDAEGRDDARQAEVPQGALGRDARPRSSCRSGSARSSSPRSVKRRLIDEMKEAVEGVKAVQREIERIDRQLNPKDKKQQAARKRTRRTCSGRSRSTRLKLKAMTDALEQEPAELKRTLETILAANTRPSRRRRSWSKPTSASWSPSRRSTRTAACSSST